MQNDKTERDFEMTAKDQTMSDKPKSLDDLLALRGRRELFADSIDGLYAHCVVECVIEVIDAINLTAKEYDERLRIMQRGTTYDLED